MNSRFLQGIILLDICISIDDIEIGGKWEWPYYNWSYYFWHVLIWLSYWLTASIAAYFITVDKTVLESARRNSRAQFDKTAWMPDLKVVQRFSRQNNVLQSNAVVWHKMYLFFLFFWVLSLMAYFSFLVLFLAARYPLMCPWVLNSSDFHHAVFCSIYVVQIPVCIDQRWWVVVLKRMQPWARHTSTMTFLDKKKKKKDCILPH